MTAHAWLDHAAPYALGALDENERASFEEHLASCEICAAEVRELKDVAGLLATAASPVTPPARLRDRIMSDARAVRPIVTAPPADTPRTQAPPRARETGAVPAGRRWSIAAPWLAAAAAVVVAVYLGMESRSQRVARIS